MKKKQKTRSKQQSATAEQPKSPTAEQAKARGRREAESEPSAAADEDLESKARLTAAKLFRRLRKSVTRDDRNPPTADDEVLALLARVGEQALPIAQAALDDERWEARYAALTALAYLSRKGFKLPEATVEQVMSLVRDDDSAVRAATVELLGLQRQHVKLVMPALVKALGDRNAEISRTAVAQVLELSPSRRALTKTMVKVLEGKRSQLAKIGAMMVLFHLGKAAKDAASVLLPFLEDESAEVREYAHLALMGIRTPSMRIQIERTASMRIKVKDALTESAEQQAAASNDLTEEELDELSELGEVESEVGSAAEPEPEPRAPKRAKGVAPRKRRGLAAKRRRRF